MASSIETYLREFAQLNGMSVERVSTVQAQQDKMADRRRDRDDIASGQFSASEIGRRNSAGLTGTVVVKDKSPAYR